MGILAIRVYSFYISFGSFVNNRNCPPFYGLEAPDQASSRFRATVPLLSPLMVDGSQDTSGHPICKSTNPFREGRTHMTSWVSGPKQASIQRVTPGSRDIGPEAERNTSFVLYSSQNISLDFEI